MRDLMGKRKIAAVFAGLLLALALSSCGGEPLLTPIGEPESSGEASSAPASSAPPSSLSDLSGDLADSLAESSAPEPEADPLVGSPIPLGTVMEESYLDDAIFIGDSLTYGLGAYQVLDAGKVLASTGINPQTILTSA